MSKGVQMLMKSMGIDPDALLQQVQEQVGEVTRAVTQGEAKIARIEQRVELINHKLDAIMARLGMMSDAALDTPPRCAAAERLTNGVTIDG